MPHPTYDLRPIQTPRLKGTALRLAVALLERPAIRSLIHGWINREVGLGELRRARVDEPPTFYPLHQSEACASRRTGNDETAAAPQKPERFRFRGIREYQEAYGKGLATPEQVAERVLAAIAESERLPIPLRAFIACDRDDVMAQAREATTRLRAGGALGPLDGVPVAVKDEVDMAPYATTAGTRFLGASPAAEDSTVVTRLRSAGAMLIGKTNMHEIGILPSGVNPHYGAVRNPYDPACDAGGSSGGSAAAVASGLCVAAIGADGGGSIRIPAGFCGIVGLKPTFGRVSEFGAVPLAWSVGHLGPMAATAEDAALIYKAIAGPDPRDSNTQSQPPVEAGCGAGSLEGVRIGIYREWFADAASEIVAACDEVLEHFVRLGADLVEVAIPDLRLMAVAHGLTIHTEMAANVERYYRGHRVDFGMITRFLLANVRGMRAGDYVQAQRVRMRALEVFRSALDCADVIATPTTPWTAPKLSRHAALGNELDIGEVVGSMRFIHLANFTGLPAISIPAGYDGCGLPIGLHLTARPWEESLLLSLAAAAESAVVRQRPCAYFDPLPESE